MKNTDIFAHVEDKSVFPDTLVNGTDLTPSGVKLIQGNDRRDLASILSTEDQGILLDHMSRIENRLEKTEKDVEYNPATALYNLYFIMQDVAKVHGVFHGEVYINSSTENAKLRQRVVNMYAKLSYIFRLLEGAKIATYDMYGGKRIVTIKKVDIFNDSVIDVTLSNNQRMSLFGLLDDLNPKHLVRPVDKNITSVTHYVSSTLDLPLSQIQLLNTIDKSDVYLYKITLLSGESFMLKLQWVNAKVLASPGKRSDYMRITLVSKFGTKSEDPRLKQFANKIFLLSEGKQLIDVLSNMPEKDPAIESKKPSFWEKTTSTVKGWWKKLGF